MHWERNCAPDFELGDMIVIIKVKGHQVFKRKGADLMINKEIVLLEALTAVSFQNFINQSILIDKIINS